jgi:hypothetical protein
VALRISDNSGTAARNAPMEYEVISSNEKSTRHFLEHAGVQSIQSSRLSLEQISVQILKNATGR